ncbi:MAG TPA: Fic family protein [Candidatus Sulfotelmatobacter sp.]|jgi:Fic family protein|nr:Fic family protein [Candidatus Sulfotelmatobacter sp.]
MFKPQFTLNFRMLNLLATIERLYGKIQGEKLIPSLSLRLSQENQILATHYSTSIEGNPLSPQDVTNVVLGDQIPTTKSEQEVKNYFTIITSLPNLVREHTPITVTLTEKLHKTLMKGIEKENLGQVRNGPVFVGHKTKQEIVVKHNPPFHMATEIHSALDELFIWLKEEKELHPLLKAAILHHQFAYIHPFFDGNGRLARILTTYYLLFEQYEVSKYFIIDDYYDIDRHLYSDCLHSADNGDKTSWIEYFLEGISVSLQGALARIDELKRSHLDKIEGEKRVLVTPREEEVLQIVINKKAIKTSDIEQAFVVSRQQAHALLASLVSKKLVRKYGKTKTSYYKLRERQK